MQIFDTHAHYYDARFEKESEGGADAILQSIMPDPVACILNVSTNCQNARLVIGQAARYAGMYAAVGIHPEDCHGISSLDDELTVLESMISDPAVRKRDKLVALGEIGLDYHYEYYGEVPLDKKREQYLFDAQMELAARLGLPVIVHDREAHGDCFETVLRYPSVRGVFHSFSGSAEMAKELIRRGWHLSFSGTLTFQNAKRVREAAAVVPRDRLLIETDAPYLAPHPKRGTLNHSGLLTYTLGTLSQIWDCSVEFAAAQTFENAKNFFLIS